MKVNFIELETEKKMMTGIIVPCRVFIIRNMTTGTKLIIIVIQFRGMSIMTIGTFHPLMKHFALYV